MTKETEGEVVGGIARVTSGNSPGGSGWKSVVMTVWSAVREKTLHAGTVATCFTILYVLFFAPVLFSRRLLGAGDALIYYLPNFIRGITFWDPLLWGGFPVAADPQAMTWYPLSILFAALGSWNGFVAAAWIPLPIWTVESLVGGVKAVWIAVGTCRVGCRKGGRRSAVAAVVQSRDEAARAHGARHHGPTDPSADPAGPPGLRRSNPGGGRLARRREVQPHRGIRCSTIAHC